MAWPLMAFFFATIFRSENVGSSIVALSFCCSYFNYHVVIGKGGIEREGGDW